MDDWKPEVEQLARLRNLRKRMGGPDGVARQHAQGRLTVRERIDLFADAGSFQETSTLAGRALWDDDGQVRSFRADAYVTGQVLLGGRPAIVEAGDFTNRGGSSDSGIPYPRVDTARLAAVQRIPFIRLLDGAGGSVRNYDPAARAAGGDGSGPAPADDEAPLVQIGPTGTPGSFDLAPRPDFSGLATAADDLASRMAEGNLLAQVPVVAVVLGSVAGLPAVHVGDCHFSVMTKTAETFVGGPPMVAQALGVQVTKQQLGDWTVQAKVSGVVNNVAETEADAFAQVRRFLSYLPPSVWQLPPWLEPADDPNRRDDYLISAIPKRRTAAYDVRRIIRSVVDKDSGFEISPLYGRSIVTMFARLDGFPVAVIANDCRHDGGAMTPAACIKAERFIDVCDNFHLPIVYLGDVPGFMIGLDSEAGGIIRFANRLSYAIREARVPYISIVIRRMYGVASVLAKPDGLSVRYAWPSAESGSLVAQGGVMAAYRREIEAAPDPTAKRLEIEDRFQRMASVLRQPALARPQEVIDPRDTRPAIVDFIRKTHAVNATRLGPRLRVGMRP
ncbi:MAG TPA: carboxyl transferase domain-containing protein [Caulobacteraceae bacterium]|jgi:acetyl-CoA carboxylase carboxyltransferase component|nr:carboxyl transferase domain-containing protein [Caulobacteraceae bacterium]